MLNKKRKQKLGTFMCLILRHNPKEFNLEFDELGFCSIESLLKSINNQERWKDISLQDLNEVVTDCEKQRYEINNSMIRATYGHSFMKVYYEESKPPHFLYHGTHKGVVDKILIEGIKSMDRQYVHLSETTHFASLAGKRRGELVLLKVNTVKAESKGIKFYYAGNEVWLSSFVPKECIEEVVGNE